MTWLFVELAVTRGAAAMLLVGGAMAGSLATVAALPWIFRSVDVEWIDEEVR